MQNLRDSIIPDLTHESRSIVENYAEKHFSKRDYEISLEYHILKPNLSNAFKTDVRNLSQYISSFEDYISAFNMFSKPSPEMNILLTKIKMLSARSRIFIFLKSVPGERLRQHKASKSTSRKKQLVF